MSDSAHGPRKNEIYERSKIKCACAMSMQGWVVQLMVKRASLAIPDFQADADEFKPARWLEADGQPIKCAPICVLCQIFSNSSTIKFWDLACLLFPF